MPRRWLVFTLPLPLPASSQAFFHLPSLAMSLSCQPTSFFPVPGPSPSSVSSHCSACPQHTAPEADGFKQWFVILPLGCRSLCAPGAWVGPRLPSVSHCWALMGTKRPGSALPSSCFCHVLLVRGVTDQIPGEGTDLVS